jgi:MOSC domain-containing protein YiiM
MARLLSVNVGLPRDIEWKGRTVHTAIWKNPVAGRCRVSRLNLEGDGQGDLVGHGVSSKPSSSTRSNRIATGSST